MKENRISYIRLFIFLLIAVSLSNIFRFDILGTKARLEELPSWLYLPLTALLEGSGVLIGALLALYLLRRQRRTQINFGGTFPGKALLMALVPLLLLSFTGIRNGYGLQPNLYGFIAVSVSLLYCIMEEYGWRGYLQEELRSLKPLYRYPLIGLIWYLWHLSFLVETSLAENLFFLGMLIFGSWGIGQVTESTRSVLAGACFHLIIQLLMFNSLIKDGIDTSLKLTVLGISVAAWLIILNTGRKKIRTPESRA
ncbi:MAG: CPBP family intramembrane glutamic endopeptidase [Flavobacteriales bacterium]